jgi:hypothetical protein
VPLPRSSSAFRHHPIPPRNCEKGDSPNGAFKSVLTGWSSRRTLESPCRQDHPVQPDQAKKFGTQVKKFGRQPLTQDGVEEADELIPERHMIDEPVTQYQVEYKDDQRTDNEDEGER